MKSLIMSLRFHWQNFCLISFASNASAESVVAEVATLTKDTKFSYHDVAKVVTGNFTGFYAIATETSDTSRMNELDELEINYLKSSFEKWFANENDLDSRETEKLRILFRSELMLMENLDIP